MRWIALEIFNVQKKSDSMVICMRHNDFYLICHVKCGE